MDVIRKQEWREARVVRMGTYVSRTVHARTTVRAATGTDKHGERTSGGQGRIERRERERRAG